jgi:hypothetical protein
MTIKYTKIFHSKTLQRFPNFGFWVWEYSIWQPWLALVDQFQNFRPSAETSKWSSKNRRKIVEKSSKNRRKIVEKSSKNRFSIFQKFPTNSKLPIRCKKAIPKHFIFCMISKFGKSDLQKYSNSVRTRHQRTDGFGNWVLPTKACVRSKLPQSYVQQAPDMYLGFLSRYFLQFLLNFNDHLKHVLGCSLPATVSSAWTKGRCHICVITSNLLLFDAFSYSINLYVL